MGSNDLKLSKECFLTGRSISQGGARHGRAVRGVQEFTS